MAVAAAGGGGAGAAVGSGAGAAALAPFFTAASMEAHRARRRRRLAEREAAAPIGSIQSNVRSRGPYVDGGGAAAYGGHLLTCAGFGLALMNGATLVSSSSSSSSRSDGGVFNTGNPAAVYAAAAYGNDPDGWTRMGELLLACRQPAQAFSWFRRAASTDPSHAAAVLLAQTARRRRSRRLRRCRYRCRCRRDDRQPRRRKGGGGSGGTA